MQVRQLIGESRSILYSCSVEKYNRYGFTQPRFVLVTEEHLWTLEQGEHNFVEHRQVLINCIEAFTISNFSECTELVIHVAQDYDERYSFLSMNHLHNLMNVLKYVLQVSGYQFKFFKVPASKLSKYATLKRHKKY